MIGTVILYLLAAVGVLAILAGIGVWLFVWRLPEAELDDAAPVDVVTGNVRVIRDSGAARVDWPAWAVVLGFVAVLALVGGLS